MYEMSGESVGNLAGRLVALYNQPFGGKPRGRYRISMKLLNQFLQCRRLWPDQIESLRRELYERGFQLIDMETYFVVVSHQTFTGYRRVNRASLEDLSLDDADSGSARPIELSDDDDE